MGAEAVHELLNAIDLEHEIGRLREEIPQTNSETKIKKLSKRLKLMEAFQAPATSLSGWSDRPAGAAAGPASAGSAGWRSLRDFRPERPVSSGDQP